MPETAGDILLRHVTIADLRTILGELDRFWGDRDTAFLHQALYVHEFGETSVLAERDGEIVAYLLGFIEPERRRLHPRRGRTPVGPGARAADGDSTAASWSSCRPVERTP